MDIYAACVLGQIDTVTSILDADPALIHAKAEHSHGKAPLYFAAEQPEVQTLLASRAVS
jgi:hypothetical protein